MFALTFYLLPLFYLTFSISEDEFIIVSTTEKPSEQHTRQSRPNTVYKNDEEIEKLKSRLEFLESKNKQSTTDEILYRRELLELKNTQIIVNENINNFVKKIEVLLESKNEQSKVIYEKIDKFQLSLETEFKNKQTATDEKINQLFDKFDTLDSKLDQIALKSNKQCATEEKLNKIYPKLDVFKSKNKQSANEEKINTILDKFDTLDSKIKEIAQKLGTMNQTLPQSTNYNDSIIPKNCREVQRLGHNVTKIYKIQPDSSPNHFEVLCDMERRGGGWTYFLNRFDGSQNFDLDWNDYKIGFGKPTREVWLGLENIHYLTGCKTNELLVELMDWDNKVVYAYYDAFSVGNESEGYSLKVLGKYEGTAGDSFRESAKIKFTTKDKDQDTWTYGNCATNSAEGGWWYNKCGSSYLTGKYYDENMFDDVLSDDGGINWYGFHRDEYSLKKVKMMIKFKNN